MEPATKKRKGYPTNPQKMRLIQLLEADSKQRGSKFSATFTKKVAEARWAAVALELNSIPGAKKDWPEWRRTWQDMKSKTKKKESAVRRTSNGTGGGPPPDPLSGDDLLILNTISRSELEGHSDVEESVCNLPKSSKIMDPDLPGSSQIVVQDVPTIKDTQDNSEEETNVQNSEGFNKENIEKKKTYKRKISGKRQLDRSLDTVTALKETLEDKNKYKIFYENYIIEMRRQTDALLLIANNLKKE